MSIYLIAGMIPGILILITDFLLLADWLFKPPEQKMEGETFPFLSILVAARNEENIIGECVAHLLQLDYPEDHMEILIGDDRSTDGTWEILSEIQKSNPLVKIFSIRDNLKNTGGKSNVLAQLAHKARGDYYLITDADTMVPPNWPKGLLTGFKQNNQAGIVTAVTSIRSNNTFHHLQNTEWLNAFGMLKTINDYGIPVTAIGNNMMINKAVYWETGGYENIGFSLVEDFQLTRKVLRLGYMLEIMVNDQVKAISMPAKNLRNLLQQRKRWMYGVIKIPFIPKAILFLRALTLPIFVFLLTESWKLACLFMFVKIIAGMYFNFSLFKKTKTPFSWWHFLLYELYAGMVVLLTLIYFLIPVKVHWKGRKY